MTVYNQFYNQLVDLLPNTTIYIQPPESLKMQYPCVIVDPTEVVKNYADNTVYAYNVVYRVIYLTKQPMDAGFEALLKDTNSEYLSTYIKNQLYHYVFNKW